MTPPESSSFLMIIGNLISPIFIALINPAILAGKNSKILLHLFQSILFSVLLCPLNLIRSFSFIHYPSNSSNPRNFQKRREGLVKTTVSGHQPVAVSGYPPIADASIPAISRALNQLLSTLNDIPVSSRKYEMVRSLAEKLIEENGLDGLNQLNSRALSAAFSDTLQRLEKVTAATAVDSAEKGIRSGLRRVVIRSGLDGSFSSYGAGMPFRLVGRMGKWSRYMVKRILWGREEMIQLGAAAETVVQDDGNEALAEKLAAELLWMAERWVACGGAIVAVEKWGSATRLARISLFAWPRLQCGLIKLTAFLIKQAKDLQMASVEENGSTEEMKEANNNNGDHKQVSKLDRIKVRMLISWMPLLCRGINGTDTPILSTSERRELERALQEIIDSVQQEEDKERVLSAWLHHFIRCPISDWPNLYTCYLRWCSNSRQLYLKNYSKYD